MKKLNRSLILIEGITKEDEGQELPILREFFRMLKWRCEPVKAYGFSSAEENKTAFLEALLLTKSRFVHVSSHGSDGDLTLDGNSANEVDISPQHIKQYCRTEEVQSPLKGRFVTISACGDIAPSFSLGLHKYANVAAVITPLASVRFSESVLFSMMFYFTLFTPTQTEKKKIYSSERLARYIDSFNRTKAAYLSVGGTGAHRLDYWWKDEHRVIC